MVRVLGVGLMTLAVGCQVLFPLEGPPPEPEPEPPVVCPPISSCEPGMFDWPAVNRR